MRPDLVKSTGTGIEVIAEPCQQFSRDIAALNGAGDQVGTLAAVPVVIQFLLVTSSPKRLGENPDPEKCHVPDLTVQLAALLVLPLAWCFGE